MVGGRESDYSVCPRPLLQFLQFFQFMSDKLHWVTQVTSGYVSLCRRDGTWSSTTKNFFFIYVLVFYQNPCLEMFGMPTVFMIWFFLMMMFDRIDLQFFSLNAVKERTYDRVNKEVVE